MSSILLVDDERAVRTTLAILLRQNGYNVAEASNGEEAIRKLNDGLYGLVITDLKLGAVDGLHVLQAAKETSPDTEVLVFTAYGSIESAVQAMKLGAFDYLAKPVEPDELLVKVQKALERQRMSSEIHQLRRQIAERYNLGSIIAESPEMQQILRLVLRVAQADTTVLIEGESGTGKELIARAIYTNSRRANRTFVPVNCGALPENLLESELFGYVKGSFTGATMSHRGMFEEAHEGTLFLDEIGDMAPATQAKVLRALEDGEIRRIGSNLPLKVDVRVLAATNQSLQTLVEQSRFREDLYYRLHVISIWIPPLRKHRADILPLAEHFLQRYCQEMDKRIEGFSPQASRMLLRYRWPGNVRELENTVERAVVLAEGPIIEPNDFPPELHGEKAILEQAHREGMTLSELERAYIVEVLRICSGNQTKAAELLGIGRNTLWRKLKAYDIATEPLG